MNYYQTGGHVFLESRAVAILHSALFLSCPAGTTTLSLLPPAATTDTHTHIDVCACARAGIVVLCLYYALVGLYDPQTSMPHWCGFPFLELTPQTYIPLSQYHVLSRLMPTSCPDIHIQNVHVEVQQTHTCLSIRGEPVPFS